VSHFAKRIWISLLAVAAVAAFLVATAAWALQGWCDDADPATVATVACQAQWEGHSWAVAQSVLVVLSAGAMLAGIGRALWNARLRPLAAAGACSVVAFAAVFEIGTIHVVPEPPPRLSAVSVLRPICVDGCAGGLRVAFTTARDASISFDLDRDRSAGRAAPQADGVAGIVVHAGAAPQLAAVDFAAGRHVVDVELLSGASGARRRRPLPPGRYSLAIDAELPNPISSLNHADSTAVETRRITVLPRRAAPRNG
jgi:hypothetical protein